MFRNSKRIGWWIVIAVAIGLLCSAEALAKKPPPPPADEDPVTYTFVELSGTFGEAGAVNQVDGFVEVVGRLWDNSGEVDIQRAHHWMVDSDGNVLSRDLRTLPPTEPGAVVSSQALDVNNQGVVVGYQRDDSGPPRPLLWPDAASSPVELPLPERSALGAMVTSINEAGVVVGATYNPNDQSLVAWKVVVVEGVVSVLDTQTILTAPSVMVTRIANSGYVSVSRANEPGNYRACRLKLTWDDQQVWEIAGSWEQLFDIYSQAAGVNEAGTVCGSYNDGGSWAFVMNVAGDLLELPELPGGRIRGQKYVIRNMCANALNNADALQVVGDGSIRIIETFESRGTVGVLWNVGSGAVDMTSAADGRQTYLHDINDAGWIVGVVVDPADISAVNRPVVLIPSQ